MGSQGSWKQVDGESNSERLRRVLNLARREINRQKPNAALEHLWRIRDEVDVRHGTRERAEFSLLLGEAHCAMRREDAEGHLREAEGRIEKLPQQDSELSLRLHVAYGDLFSSAFRRPSKAKEYYTLAKRHAIELGIPEETARIELKIIAADLRSKRDRQLKAFGNLRRAGDIGDYTEQEQLAAWHQFIGELESATSGIRAARGFDDTDEQYFRGVLESVRNSSK
jgi:hypothetical protein